MQDGFVRAALGAQCHHGWPPGAAVPEGMTRCHPILPMVVMDVGALGQHLGSHCSEKALPGYSYPFLMLFHCFSWV